ncbi:WD40 repeat [Solimonas aquatica]|uniref:WD40 repeat n=1 Tax=Solimonas aquatica TaxID=489703 RepID=A0A1H9DPS9_9GAMM|nr:TIR domain-containing protein [Solimonas aquatica]SEQ15530.1 WD40 repeat [Solimonas aquatica]
MPQGFRYWAFISYHHRDRREAQWLHRYLERYRVPRHLLGRPLHDIQVPARLAPVFRDRDELPSSVDLGGVVQQALHQSRYLIVLCSPGAAQSRWVNEEVRSFKRLGRERNILCLRLDSAGGQQVFPPALLERYDEQGEVCGRAPEPLAADLKADTRDGAALKLIAGMLDIGYDELRRRERRRRIRNHLLAGALGLCAAASLFSAWHWQQAEKQEALRTQALQARIEMLYRNGREELLAHNEARAAAYLGEAYRLGLDTPALRFMLARAMAAVDPQQLRIRTGVPVWLADVNADLTRAIAIGIDVHLRGYLLAQPQQPIFDLPLGDVDRFFGAFGLGGRVFWLESLGRQGHEMRLFDARDGRLLLREKMNDESLDDSDYGVSPNPLSDDEREVVLLGPDRALHYGAIGASLQRLAGDYSTARYCGGRGLVTAAQDGRIELRDPRRAGVPVLRRFQGLPGRAVVLDCSRDGRLLAAATHDGAVRIWDVDAATLLMSSGHNAIISDLHFSADGQRLMTATRAQVSIWQSRGGALLYAERFLDPAGNPAVMNPEGSMLARIGEGRLSVVDTDSGASLYSLDAHLGGVNAFNFAPDGQHAVSGGNDGTLVIWRLPQAAQQQYRDGTHQAPPLAFASDGRYFVGGSQGGLYDAQGRRQPGFGAGATPALRAALSKDGRQLALADESGALQLHSLPDDRLLDRYAGVAAKVVNLGFDHSGAYLAQAIKEGGIRVLELGTHRQRHQLATDFSRAFAFSPRQAEFAYGSGDTLYLQPTAADAPRWRRQLAIAPATTISAVVFSDDGSRLLVLAERRWAFVIDVASGRLLQRLDHPAAVHFSMGAFSRDGDKIAIADAGKTMLLWHLPSRRYLTLSGHNAAVHTVAFSPDGSLLLSAADDGRLRIWDSQDGELLYSFNAHAGSILPFAAGFAPDGRLAYTTGSDGATRLWPMSGETRTPAQLQQLLRCKIAWVTAGRGLRALEPDPRRCAP